MSHGRVASGARLGAAGAAFIIVGGLLTVLFIYGIYSRQTLSEASPLHALAPWGLMVTGYVFFAISSGGVYDALAIRVAILGQREARNEIRKLLVLALALLVPGIALVFADLLHIEHSLWIYLGFNPESRIAWNGILYIVYAAFLLATMVYVFNKGEDSLYTGLGKALLVGGLLASLALEYNLALAFGYNVAIPGWFAAPLGVFNIALAFMLGAAWIAIGLGVVARAASKLSLEEWRHNIPSVSKELAGMALAVGFITGWMLLQQTGWGLAEKTAEILTSGELAGLFWLSILLAVIVPISLGLIATWRKAGAALLLASVLAVLGGFTLLHSVVAAGQVVRLEALEDYHALALHSIGENYAEEALHELLTSRAELASVIGAIGLWLLLYVLGLQILAVEPYEKPRRLLLFR
ncbi:NrfD/PsrC family molybdoenzyme membrane anchor subunit [Hyperthermus butylicus]|uniref:Polysulfide reductase n=1 Tax=Hyperthermus butylicus (strain DSM 5456 / JCM 9403 / PLM1-5) TaxID=415426 RepID=A2BJT1_HYPBU|nr:NrfD/PsrC family molybdoenzyme membrane anchor subunit [Hyperthermus butylicus]ABM80242.1 hypothetical protein Hbut_0371 [Hyperthermus butylicus DSM 5456]